jgi:hypothetical protein
MKMKYVILFALIAMLSVPDAVRAQSVEKRSSSGGFIVPMCVYDGDTIPWVQLPTVYIYKPLKFKNAKERAEYLRLVRNVKKVYPIAKEVNKIVLETYEYLQTLPNDKARQKHIKMVEKGVKEQYTPIMKKLTFSQGKLLIKLIDRQNNQTSYELVKAFMGPFKAGFYQTFAAMFGASLKKQYDPTGKDAMVERVITLVENGQL